MSFLVNNYLTMLYANSMMLTASICMLHTHRRVVPTFTHNKASCADDVCAQQLQNGQVRCLDMCCLILWYRLHAGNRQHLQTNASSNGRNNAGWVLNTRSWRNSASSGTTGHLLGTKAFVQHLTRWLSLDTGAEQIERDQSVRGISIQSFMQEG